VNITKESVSATEVTLNVELDPEDEEPFITRSYRRLVSRINIPGFRPGKAPRSIVENHLGRSALVHEALEFMVPETLDQILKQENLQAFMEPELEVLEIEPVSFKAVVPLEPVVQLGDLSSISVTREPVDITNDQVDEVIEQLRYESAPWEPVDRPVQFGDLLSLNVAGVIGGEEAIDDQGIDFIPQVDNPVPIPGFSVYLEGMVEGQEKEFTLTIPEDHHQNQYAGKECRIQVEVLSVKAKTLPELDDEFAKGIREGYESLEALGNDVRQRLTEAAENASARRLEQEGLEELLKISTIQASGLIYQRELDRLYEERERAVRSQRLDMDTYLSYIGTTQEEWREQLQPQAEQRLNHYLVLRKLAQDQGIDIDPEEVQAEIDSMLEESGDSEEPMRRVLDSENARESIRSSLLSRKVLGRMVEIIQGEAEQPASLQEAMPDMETDESSSVAEETTETESPVSEETEEIEEGAKPDAE
jgi:trigger factor